MLREVVDKAAFVLWSAASACAYLTATAAAAGLPLFAAFGVLWMFFAP